MLVKIFKNKGKGSAKASLKYLLNKPRIENGTAKILSGDPNLSLDIANSLKFSNKYTVGCLSFQELNIPINQKAEIIELFESTVFAGLKEENYNITWIQHIDKGRLELNFFIPNVELSTGKRYQPYYHATHKHLFNAFRDLVNYKYNLTDPTDPSKKQAYSINRNLPKDVKKIQEYINQAIEKMALNGLIETREDVINFLQNNGFKVARITPKNISIENPSGKRNIRLKGIFYNEDFRFSEEITRAEQKNGKDITGTTTGATTGTREFNQTIYAELQKDFRNRIEKHAKDNIKKYHFTDSNKRNFGSSANYNININNMELDAKNRTSNNATGNTTATEREREEIDDELRKRINKINGRRKGRNDTGNAETGRNFKEYLATATANIKNFATATTNATANFRKAIAKFATIIFTKATTTAREQQQQKNGKDFLEYKYATKTATGQEAPTEQQQEEVKPNKELLNFRAEFAEQKELATASKQKIKTRKIK